MSSIQRFEDLEIWQLARQLCKEVFDISSRRPFINDFTLKDQIRSSSGSVMDNIAEGFERSGNKEFSQFLYIAKGSAGETRSQLYRALDQVYLSVEEHKKLNDQTVQLSKKIGGLINYLSKSSMKGTKYIDRTLKP
jgi:four helix bundle protein